MQEIAPAWAAQKRELRAILSRASQIWRTAAQSCETEDAMWSRYLPILEACRDVLSHAPLHPDEALKLTTERRLNTSLERLAGALKISLFGGNLGELEGFLVTDLVRERRRRAGLNRYLRAKRKRRKR